jgi:pimeloyl-ACP methyl ester carboxylesterase
VCYHLLCGRLLDRGVEKRCGPPNARKRGAEWSAIKPRMSIFFELRYPTRWYSKILAVILVLVFFTVLSTATIAGYLVYRIVKPQRTSSEINMQSFPGRPDAVIFTVPGLGEREGWFFPGLRGAPTIVLCHGYQSSRGELLTLVSALQDHQYNVFVFDFAAHGKNGGATTFGFRETDELRGAINSLAQRNDVDPARFGVWGYNLGAYVALSEAENDKRIRALVLDSVYDAPEQMVKMQVEKTGLAGFPLMVKSAQVSFRWLNSNFRQVPPLSKGLPKLAGVPKLFIQATDDPELAETTRQMFLRSPDPREQVVIPHGNIAGMGDPDKRDYQNRVVSYFLLNLPATGLLAR